MVISRRIFLRRSGMALSSVLSGGLRPPVAVSQAASYEKSTSHHGSEISRNIPRLIDPGKLTPFVDPLLIPEIARPSGMRDISGGPNAATGQIPYYRISMRQISAQIHREVKPTNFWSYGPNFPGPTFETRSGHGLSIDWANDLPSKHFLPIDHNLCGAERGKPEVRTVVHLHGAIVPPESDGYPENWYAPGKSAIYHYPNRQDATMLWYHDHSMGIERLNLYAGLFGAFIIRDDREDALNLPSGKYEIPLLLADRMFREDGQLYYPASADPENPWVPEVLGNCVLVNGKLLPYLEVEPRKYRLRVLNASNARAFRLTLANGQTFQQIGTDQGLLAAPVGIKRVAIAPAERADLVVDFSGNAGEEIILNNEILPLMQFRVSQAKVQDKSSLPAALHAIDKISASAATVSRMLTLNEYDDLAGKPSSMLLDGKHWHDPVSEKPVRDTVEIWSFVNLTSDAHPIHLHQARFQILDRRTLDVPAFLQSSEVRFRGAPIPPAANEAGWKDTVRAEGKSITRIIVRFDGYPGRYVWHCHTLEHAANEMMRPYEIVQPSVGQIISPTDTSSTIPNHCSILLLSSNAAVV
jgi:spore coat protein A, manganese oxidase